MLVGVLALQGDFNEHASSLMQIDKKYILININIEYINRSKCIYVYTTTFTNTSTSFIYLFIRRYK